MNLKDLKKALQTNESFNTLEELKNAKQIYKAISQECFKTKKWTVYNLALSVYSKACLRYINGADLNDFRKSIFITDNGDYNVVLATIENDKFIKQLSFKVTNESVIMDLIDNHEFYLIG